MTKPTNPFQGGIDPLMVTDAYKLGHVHHYTPGVTRVLANVTARGSRIEGVDYAVSFGWQAFLDDLRDLWQPFFDADEDAVCAWYEYRVAQIVGPNNVGSDHIRALHQLGYLPLRFRAIPEGTKVPLRVPMVTIENTVDHAYWLVNYIETHMASATWQPVVTATIAHHFRELLDEWAEETSDTPEFVDWQGHDFSSRGMANHYAAASSGAAHLLSFAGSDSLAALDWVDTHYDAGDRMVLGSVPATEHAVMCSAGKENELDTFARLLELHDTGILSVVSDTWDLFGGVIGRILPALKEQILSRDGKLVIRPDSGDPADILCGDPNGGFLEYKGVIECLWDIFGGTVNSKGYKVLDPHIGAIYGDSITYDRAQNILNRLAAKGFASTNVVFGIGSYTYQMQTRDSLGLANKTTWVKVNGEGRDVWKDPKTDKGGVKKSAVGRVAVLPNEDGVMELVNNADALEEAMSHLRPIWRDGIFEREETWGTIVDRVGKRVIR